MRTMLASITALLLGAFFMLVGTGLTNTLVPLVANSAGFSPVTIGIIGAAQNIGFAMGCLLAPLVVRRAGHIRAFATFSGIAACTILILPILLSPIAWPFLRAGAGFCFAGMFMVIESWLNERASNEYRGRVFSIYQVVVLVGALGGQQLLGLGDINSFELFSFATILLTLALIPVALTASRAPEPLQTVKPRMLWLFRQSPVAVVGVGLVGMANGALWSLGPVFANEQGLSSIEVGWFMSAIIAGGALTQWPIGRASDRFDRRWVIIAAASASCLVGLSFFLLQDLGRTVLLVQGACYGGAALALYSLCVAHVNDLVEPEDFVHVSSGTLLMFGGCAIIGSLLGSAVMQVVDNPALFLFTASCHASIVLFTVYRLFLRPRIVSADRDPFVVSMPRPAPVVSSLDPRVDGTED